MAVDTAGTIYFSDTANHRVLKVLSGSNQATVVVGTGVKGFAGDGAAAVNANLDTPSGLAFDNVGNLYIADSSNRRVRKLTMSTGLISTYAGNGIKGHSGNGGQATSASMVHPTGIAFDNLSNLYISDSSAHSVRKVAPTGIITAFAGTSGEPGNIGDGGAATAARLRAPAGLYVDGGQVYIADSQNHKVRRVDASGVISTVAGVGVRGFDGDGGVSTSAKLSYPSSVTLDVAGNLIIADTGNLRLRRVATNLTITTYAGIGKKGTAGDGGAAASANLSYPMGVARDPAGNILVADTVNQRIRRIDRNTGIITSLVGNHMSQIVGVPQAPTQLVMPAGMAVDATGQIVVADSGAHAIFRVNPANGAVTHIAGNGISDFAGDGGPAISASLSQPMSVAIDSAGNIFIADLGNQRVRRIEAGTNVITTYAGDGNADFQGDGGPAVNARLSYPTGLAIASNGDLLIADSYNNRVRRVNSAGVISTFAGNGSPYPIADGEPAITAGIDTPTSLAVDGAGDVYITEKRDYRLRKVVAATGNITSTQIYNYPRATTPFTVAVTQDGTAYVALPRFDLVRRLNSFSSFSTQHVANNVMAASGMAFGQDGSLYISETGNRAIRKVTFSVPATPTIYDTTVGDRTITLNVSVGTDGGKPVLDYTANCGTVSGMSAGPVSIFGSITLTGLTNGTAYTCTVTARNAVGTSAPSAPSAPLTPSPPKTVPGAPTSVTAVAGASQATVSFQPPASDGNSPITGYVVRNNGWAMSGGQASPITVIGLNNGQAYTFTVEAVNAIGTGPASAPSNSVTPVTTPNPPTSVFATPGNGTLTVSFSPTSTGGSPILEFVATCGTQSQAGASSPITVTGLANGTAYTCTVRATNAQGSSPASAPSASATPRTVPDAPQSVTGTPGNGQITIAWQPPLFNGGANIGEYHILVNGVFTAIAQSSPYTLTGLFNGTAYTVAVRAANNAGAGPATQAPAPVTPSTVPTSPNALTLTPGDKEIRLTFSGGSNGGSPIIEYVASCQGSSAPEVVTQAGSASPITITGLSNGNTYTCWVRATNANGMSAIGINQTTFLPADTTVQVTATPNPAVQGGDITITAEVTGAGPGGSITFQRDGTTFCTRPMTSGRASCVTNAFNTVGTFEIRAVYPGDSTNRPASATLAGGLTITPANADTTPDPFSFISQNGVLRSTTRISNAITPTGINAPTTVSVAGGEYATGCLGLYTSATAQLQPGQSICVRHTSAAAPNTATTTTLTIGGVAGTFTTTTGEATLSRAYDFTGDGMSDMLWRNTATGALFGKQLTGMTLGGSHTPQSWAVPDWKVVAIADIDGNNAADIVLRNDVTGAVDALLMLGFVANSRTVLTEPNLNWKLVGAGDFNGNGHADLLWRNSATGDVFVHFMSNGSVASGSVIYSEPSANWQIQQTADFNGDGRADILWRNSATGDVFVLLMNGATVTGGGVIYSEPNTNWQIQSAADFNGDGKADILWRNIATGDLFMMLMNGTTIVGGSVFYSEPNVDWKIVATGDYNGDGRSDILWRNSATGQVFMMLMNGTTISSGGFIYTEPDTNWKVLGTSLY